MGKLVDDTKVRLREAKETKTRAAEVEAELESLKVQLEQANGSIKELNVLKERIVMVEAECAKAKQMADAQKSNAASFHREVVCQSLLVFSVHILTWYGDIAFIEGAACKGSDRGQ